MAVFVPGDVPAGTVTQISDATRKAVADPELVRQFNAQGLIIKTGTPTEIKALFDREVDGWTKVIQEARIKPQ